jgi:hypothetical protein
MSMERYMIDAYGVDLDAERDAFGWLILKAKELGTEAAVVVAGVDTIENLGRVLGVRPRTSPRNTGIRRSTA